MPATKEELEKQIEEALESLETQASTAISNAVDDHSKYEESRLTGKRKVGRVTQRFVKSFSDFVKVYSPVVDLLKGAAGPYGVVGYETLSILFTV